MEQGDYRLGEQNKGGTSDQDRPMKHDLLGFDLKVDLKGLDKNEQEKRRNFAFLAGQGKMVAMDIDNSHNTQNMSTIR